MNCKKTTFQQWGPLDKESLETNVSSWLYREENEAATDIPKQIYPKAYSIVDKMGYKGNGIGPQEQGRKVPISPISYKYNRGLGYSPVPKITTTGAPTESPTEIKDFNKEEFHEMPFEYLDDIVDDVHNNTTPCHPFKPI